MKGYISRTSNELERHVLTNLINGLNERITFLGEELMDLEEDEFDFRVKNALAKDGHYCLDEEYSNNKILDDINIKKYRITKELDEAKDTYTHIKGMLF
jgi:hypothetical protein